MGKEKTVPEGFGVEGEVSETFVSKLTPKEKETYNAVLQSTAFRKENYITSREHAKLFIDNIIAEKEWFEGTKHVLEELKNEGIEASLDAKDVAELKRVSDYVFRLRYYRQLVHAAGLAQFEDIIIRHLIDGYFASPHVHSSAQKRKSP